MELLLHIADADVALLHGDIQKENRNLKQICQSSECQHIGVTGDVGIDDAAGLWQEPAVCGTQKGLVVAAERF